MSLKFKSEEELARHVCDWLISQDYEIFQEVQPGYGDHRADVVGRRGPIIVVIETKLTFSDRVIEQAHWWQHEANFVFVAVPYCRSHVMLELLCRHLGIGMLKVSGLDYEGPTATRVNERIPPRFFRRRSNRLSESLTEGHKNYAVAGNATNQYWTPFKQTCEALRCYLNGHDGATLKEAMAAIRHHYSSPVTARGAIRKWVERGKVPGVRSELQGRQIRLYLERT